MRTLRKASHRKTSEKKDFVFFRNFFFDFILSIYMETFRVKSLKAHFYQNKSCVKTTKSTNFRKLPQCVGGSWDRMGKVGQGCRGEVGGGEGGLGAGGHTGGPGARGGTFFFKFFFIKIFFFFFFFFLPHTHSLTHSLLGETEENFFFFSFYFFSLSLFLQLIHQAHLPHLHKLCVT